MSSVLDRGIQQVSAVAIIFVAASYSFTLGYIEYLKIPETPEYLEAANFFIRAILYAGKGAAFLVTLLICFFLALIFGIEKLISKRFEGNCKSFIMYLVFIFLTTTLALYMYCWGENSLKNKEGPVFPMALLSEKSSEKYRIVWFGKKATYYLRCGAEFIESELRGVNDERKIIFSRRVPEDSSPDLCKQ